MDYNIEVFVIMFVWSFVNRLLLNYNLEGNYFDENSAVVYHSQAVLVFGILALLFLISTLIFVYLTIKSLKNQKKTKSNC